MEREVANQVAAPAETRTPNWHRAKMLMKSADGRVAPVAALGGRKTLSHKKPKQPA
jgi:hypothetical protein